MSKLINELELALDRLIEDRTEHYSNRQNAEDWITQDFAEWLVKKFEEEKYNV
jgi:hypothetical protein